MNGKVASKEFDLVAFSKKTKEEKAQLISSGEVVPPKRGAPERAEFERALSGVIEAPPASAPAAPPAPPAPKAPEPAPAKPVESGIEETPPEPAPAATPAAPAPGAPQEQDRIKQLEEAVSKQAELIRTLNNTARDRGRKAAELEKQLKETTSRIEELQKKAPPASPAIEELGEAPKPEDFEGGIMSEEFATAQYNYMLGLVKMGNDLKKQNTELRTELSEIKPKVQTAADFANTEESTRRQSAVEQAQARVWDATKQFQTEFNLKTSVPFETINDNLLTIEAGNADPEVKKTAEYQAAVRFINTLPKADMPTFEKVRDALSVFAEWENGVPRTNYRTIKAALVDNDMIDRYNAVRPAPPAPTAEAAAAKLKSQELEQGAGALPVDRLAGGDGHFQRESTDAEDKQEMLAMDAERSRDPKAFKDSSKWQRYVALRLKFGVPVPGTR